MTCYSTTANKHQFSGMRIFPLLATLRYSSVKAFSSFYQQAANTNIITTRTTTTAIQQQAMGREDKHVATHHEHKELYCVRHGKSKSNEWMEVNEWGSPGYNDYNGNIRDSSLSDIGISQAKSLTERLEHVELVVVSPLTRCLETLYHSSLVVDTPVVVLPHAAERVYSLSETGRTKAELMQEFPSSWDWSAVPERDPWWYTRNDDDDAVQEWRPVGENQVYAVPGEPMEVFAKRMERFRHWIHQRPERCILLVAHWGVIRHLSGGVEVSNCQVERIHLSSSDLLTS